MQNTGKPTRERVEELRRKNHSLHEQVRYYKNILSMREETDRKTQVHLYRQQYKDIGKLLYLWNMAEARRLTDHERVIQTGFLLRRVSGGGDGLGSLVNDINRNFNNILVHLEDDFPNMGPADFKLFCYLAVGFDNDLIAELLGLPGKSPLYMRKTRLKKRIRESDSPYKEHYLDLMEE